MLKRMPIATTTISGGYAVDYRKAALGDMSDENELQIKVCAILIKRSQIIRIRNLGKSSTVVNTHKQLNGDYNE